MPLHLMALAAYALGGAAVDGYREAKEIQETREKDLTVECPTYFKDGQRDLLTGKRCILERAGDGWITYEAKTYSPLTAYGKYDMKYWTLWDRVNHFKIWGEWE